MTRARSKPRCALAAGLTALLWAPGLLGGTPHMDTNWIPPDVSPQLRESILALYSGDRMQQIQAANQLGAMGEDAAAAVPFLTAFLWGKTDIYGATHQALRRIGKPSLEAVSICAQVTENRYILSHALGLLDEFRDERATEALAIHLARSGDRRALQILAHLGQPAVDRLLGMLSGPNPAWRGAAAQALVLAPGAAASEALARAAGDEDAYVRSSALSALNVIVQQSGGAACPPVEVILTATKDADAATRRAAYAILATLTQLEKGDYLERLVEACRDSDRGVQMTALEAISSLVAEGRAKNQAEVVNKQTGAALAEAFRDADPAVRAKAADVAAVVGLEGLSGDLTALLKDESGQVRIRAIYALGSLKVLAAVQPITDALKDMDHGVRRAAAATLGELDDKSAVPALRAAFEDSDDDLERTIKTTLAKLENTAPPKAAEARQGKPKRAIRREVLPQVRTVAAAILEPPEPPAAPSRPPPPAPTPPSANKQPATQTPASPEKLKFFALLDTPNQKLRDQAAAAAAAMPQGGLPLLLDALRTQNGLTRSTAIYVVGKNKLAGATEDLLAILYDCKGPARDEALKAFEELKGEAKVSVVLRDALKDDAKRERAVQVLAYLGDAPSVAALAGLLDSPDWRVRRVGVEGLAEAKAWGALLKAFKDPYWCVRVSAVDAAVSGGVRAVVPALIELLADEHWYVRSAAHAALTKNSGQQLPADVAAWRGWWEKEGKNAPAALK